MYVTRPPSDVIALDAETGRALWTYEHKLSGRVYVCCGEVNRGLAILGSTLFLTTLDAQLIALDARAGRVLWKKALADPGAELHGDWRAARDQGQGDRRHRRRRRRHSRISRRLRREDRRTGLAFLDGAGAR